MFTVYIQGCTWLLQACAMYTVYIQGCTWLSQAVHGCHKLVNIYARHKLDFSTWVPLVPAKFYCCGASYDLVCSYLVVLMSRKQHTQN